MDSTQENTSIEMEPNLSIMAKKFMHMVRVVYFMLRKGISKGKLMIDLKFMMMKRSKLGGKAIHNLMLFHNNHKVPNWSSAFSAISSAAHRRSHDKNNHHNDYPHFQFQLPPDEYEFSCSNSPAYPSFHLPFHLNKRKNTRHHSSKVCEDEFAMHAALKALEMYSSAAASPALPGFGKSPMVRQLRITDSPFPLRDVEEDSHVDEAAQEFIERFYKDLRKQNAMAH